jgi:pimeloyl-ACP methyl ester carboxylesterase
LALLASEPARAFIDLFASRAPDVSPAVGDGHRVIVYPGLGAGPITTWRLRSSLEDAGFVPVDWGFGLNRGPQGGLSHWLDRLASAVEDEHRRDGRKVSLVGWSLGGVFAREVSRVVPHAVRQVVTLGSPFAAEANETHAAWLYRLLSGSRPPQSRRQLQELRRPLPVPSTSIFSKSDGIVSWRGCMQKPGPLAENIEVPGVSHLGMGTNRTVLALVAERLAQPEGEWKPFASSAQTGRRDGTRRRSRVRLELGDGGVERHRRRRRA